MSNSIGTLTPTLIAQSGLALLYAKYPVIGSIVTDFSSQPMAYGETVITKIPSVGAVQSYNQSAGGYVPSAVNSTDVNVVLNNHIHASMQFNVQELTQISPVLLSQYANSFAVAIGESVMSGIASLMTTGNYNNGVTAQALTGVNRNTIITAETALNSRNVPKDSRFGILNSYMYGQLLQDPSLVSTLFVPGGPGVAGSNLPVINGIPMTEFSALPTTSYLQGVIGARDALAFVSRVPYDLSIDGNPAVATIKTVTDPTSKLSVQVIDGQLPFQGVRQITYTLMYGVAVGNPKSLQLITTA